jgi:hypothetical protein
MVARSKNAGINQAADSGKRLAPASMSETGMPVNPLARQADGRLVWPAADTRRRFDTVEPFWIQLAVNY